MSNQYHKTGVAKGASASFYAWQYLLFLAPLLILVALSLFTFENYQLGSELTFEHYRGLLSNSTYFRALFNTLILAIGAGTLAVFLGYGFCLCVVFFLPKKMQWPVILAIIAPLLTNFVLKTFSWRLVLSDNGIVNAVLRNIGAEVDFLFHPLTVVFGVAMYALPFVIFILYTTLSSIPRDLIYASENLGATWGVTFKRVIIPLSLRGIFLSAVVVLIFAFSDFVTPTILGGSSLYTLSMYLTDTLRVSNIPQIAALGILTLLPALLVIATLITVAETVFRKKMV